MSDYNAIVSQVFTSKHPNADRLQLGKCLGQQVIVGLNTKDGELGVFFPVGGQLDDRFCEFNDLLARYDEQGKKISGGYFDDKRRVRAQSFRGVKTEGFWVPLEYFLYLFILEPLERLSDEEITLAKQRLHAYFDIHKEGVLGMKFTELFGVEICRKYVNPNSLAVRAQNAIKSLPDLITFPRHVETQNIYYYVDELEKGDWIDITLKMHGTSQRVGNVYQTWTERISLSERLRAVLRGDWREAWTGLANRSGYRTAIGTRRVRLSNNISGSYYGNEKFRFDVIADLLNKIPEGMLIFGEVVGYASADKPIMQRHHIPEELKKARKQFGDTITYAYANKDGECSFYVYRIIYTREDGNHREHTWTEVKDICDRLDLNHVPELDRFEYDGNKDKLIAYLKNLVDGESGIEAVPDLIDPSHMREGIVIRVTKRDGSVRYYKAKSYAFLVCEGHREAIDDGSFDIEDAS